MLQTHITQEIGLVLVIIVLAITNVELVWTVPPKVKFFFNFVSNLVVYTVCMKYAYWCIIVLHFSYMRPQGFIAALFALL